MDRAFRRLALLLAVVAAALLLVAVVAHAATHTLTWTQLSTTVADFTDIERASVLQGKCGAYVVIGSVPFGTLTYPDTAAPTGWVCYRVRNAVLLDIGDGGPPARVLSPPSNVDTNKPGNTGRLQVQ